LINIRIDVDYPYSSRLRSFVNVALGVRVSGNYLKNAKIIAKMINESKKNVKARWFFTAKTIPDEKLLRLLDNSKHEIGLHVVNDPNNELRLLEEAAGRKINYYTIHGTARLIARIMWKRWKSKAPKIPSDFPLGSFHQYPTFGLDGLCHIYNSEEAFDKAKNYIRKGQILYFHPIWLFQRGKLNHRGPFYEALKKILEVDKEIENLNVRKKFFFKVANDGKEYERDVVLTKDFIEKLGNRGVDLFTFIERRWCCKALSTSPSWVKTSDNIALLQVTSFDWWKNIGKKTRNMIRKAEKSGIKTEIVEPNQKLAEGIWKIYNETPIRQERAFPHYGAPLQTITESVLSAQDCTFVGAFFQDELAGFIRLVHGDNIAIISQILSLQKFWDKAVNNALVARTIEVCANKGIRWIMYGRMGNHPSLDKFKQSNGFASFPLTRYYVPITKKGRIVAKMGLHREIKDALPQSIKYPLIPVYNWMSRNKMRIKIRLASQRPQQQWNKSV
jgi:hypothetical protein